MALEITLVLKQVGTAFRGGRDEKLDAPSWTIVLPDGIGYVGQYERAMSNNSLPLKVSHPARPLTHYAFDI